MTKTQPLFRVCWVSSKFAYQTRYVSTLYTMSWDAAWDYMWNVGNSGRGYVAWVEPA